MKNKGFLLYELFISFAFITVIMVVMLQTTINLRAQQIKAIEKQRSNAFKSNIIDTLGYDLKRYKIETIDPLAGPCDTPQGGSKTVTIGYENPEGGLVINKTLLLNTTNNTVTYNGEVTELKTATAKLVNVSVTNSVVNARTLYKISFVFSESDYNFSVFNQATDLISNPDVYTEALLNGNDPVWEDKGLLPVQYNGSNLISGYVKPDLGAGQVPWYKYASTDKRWANAVVLNSSAPQDICYYVKRPGTAISENWIAAHFVWIPRYKYAIPAGAAATAREIAVVFEPTNQSVGSAAASPSTDTLANLKANPNHASYISHPGFYRNGTDYSGFWVGKFETGGTLNDPKIKPGIQGIRSGNVSAYYNAASSLLSKTALEGTSTHMMSNTEWGAVAYLAQSMYGKGTTNIGANNHVTSTVYPVYAGITGCGSAADTAISVTCNAYNITGQAASTTQNNYGVYDMSGGLNEYVMGIYNSYMGAYQFYYGELQWGGTSGFAGKHFIQSCDDSDCYPSDQIYQIGPGFIESPPAYAYNNYLVSSGTKGDATTETAQWNWDGNWFIGPTAPWMVRGGWAGEGSGAIYRGIFYYAASSGAADVNIGFRTVFLP